MDKDGQKWTQNEPKIDNLTKMDKTGQNWT